MLQGTAVYIRSTSLSSAKEADDHANAAADFLNSLATQRKKRAAKLDRLSSKRAKDVASHSATSDIPLGAEIKNVSCALCRFMLHMEVYEGKERDAQKEFRTKSTGNHPTSIVTTLRLMKPWFGSWHQLADCSLPIQAIQGSSNPRVSTNKKYFFYHPPE